MSYRWHRPVCFMASEATLLLELQLKHSHPIMKPLKMLGCCQMVCHWAGQKGKPAAVETPVPWWFGGCCFASITAMLRRLATTYQGNLMYLEAPLSFIFFISSFLWESTAICFWTSTWETQAHSQTHQTDFCQLYFSYFNIIVDMCQKTGFLLVFWDTKASWTR